VFEVGDPAVHLANECTLLTGVFTPKVDSTRVAIIRPHAPGDRNDLPSNERNDEAKQRDQQNY
jgi:hypothetical protein